MTLSQLPAEPGPSEPPLPSAPDVTVILRLSGSKGEQQAAIEAIRSQTLRHLEIVLVAFENAPRDHQQLITSLPTADSRFKVFPVAEDLTLGAAYEQIIRQAKSPYVAFAEDGSWDTHGIKNLLLAAEKDAAELTVSAHRSGLDDTMSGKLFDRNLLTRAKFAHTAGEPHWEALAYCWSAAEKVTQIPEVTYSRRRVATSPDRQATLAAFAGHQRALAKVMDLRGDLDDDAGVSVQEVVGGWLATLISDVAYPAMLGSFGGGHAYRSALVDVLQPLVVATPDDAFEAMPQMRRAAFAMVCHRSPRGLNQALMYDQRNTTLAGQIRTKDGRRYWSPVLAGDHFPAAGSKTERLLEVREPRFSERPLSAVRFHHALFTARRDGSQLRMSGVTHDPLRKLSGMRGWLKTKLRGAPDVFAIPLTFTTRENGTIDWQADFAMPAGLPLARPQVWITHVVWADGALESEAPLRYGLKAAPKGPVRVKGGIQKLLRRDFTLYRTKDGQVGFRLAKPSGKRGRLDQALTKADARRHSTGTQLDPNWHPGKDWIAKHYKQLQRLPLAKGTLLVESHMGQSGWDSPRYVAEEMVRQRPDLKVIWTTKPGFPSERVPYRTVEKNSLAYVTALARSEFLVDNQSLPPYFWKRPGQRYLQTWHGTPLKKMGLDEPKYKKQSEAGRQGMIRRANRWDALVVPNPYFERTFVPAFGYRGELLTYGSPRNDVLFQRADQIKEAKARLDLPDDRQAVLYAPTFREDLMNRSKAVSLPFDLAWWQEHYGDDYYLLVRAHYLNRVEIPLDMSPYCLDVSGIDNINDVFLATDLLITDYSSVMFDYATLQRPSVYFCYDYDNYVNDARGTYADLREMAPGPFVTSLDDLPDAIASAADGEYDQRRTAFVDAFCAGEDGTASERAARFLLEGTR